MRERERASGQGHLTVRFLSCSYRRPHGMSSGVPASPIRCIWESCHSFHFIFFAETSCNMVRGYVQEHIYRHPWERVTAANWRKYADPEHRPLLSHAVDVSIVNRTEDQEGGQLLTTRSITVNTPGPWWLQRLMGTNVCQCLEESIVDNGKRSLEMITRNVTLKDFVDVEEKCSYLPHPDNANWTLFRQETNITCASMPALKSVAEKIEQKCAEKFQQNSARGREVVEFVCKALERAETASKDQPQLVVNSEQSFDAHSGSPCNTNVWKIFERAEFVGATL